MTNKKLLAPLLLCGLMSLHGVSAAHAQDLAAKVEHWQDRLQSRIGVLLRERGSAWAVAADASERFPLSSTFKPLLCGAVLARVDDGKESLTRMISYTADDLVDYSPVTSKHVKEGMSVGALCEAAITLSDNSAGNLLLKTIGGPAGLTAFLRTIGDKTTRLDRWETELNEASPGDERDTTTPAAVLDTLDRLLFGDVLDPTSAAKLRQWMIDDQVADQLLRASLPNSWTIGDKTGAGGHGSRAIIAFLQPSDGKTYLAAIYMTGSDAEMSTRNEVIADIGKAMIGEIERQ